MTNIVVNYFETRYPVCITERALASKIPMYYYDLVRSGYKQAGISIRLVFHRPAPRLIAGFYTNFYTKHTKTCKKSEATFFTVYTKKS